MRIKLKSRSEVLALLGLLDAAHFDVMPRLFAVLMRHTLERIYTRLVNYRTRLQESPMSFTLKPAEIVALYQVLLFVDVDSLDDYSGAVYHSLFPLVKQKTLTV